MLASHKPILEPTSNRFETNIKFRIDNKFVLQHAHKWQQDDLNCEFLAYNSDPPVGSGIFIFSKS